MEWLKNKRVEKGLSQQAVADGAQIARGAYSNIENGERRPSVEVAKRIGGVLGFPWTRFFESEEEAGESA